MAKKALAMNVNGGFSWCTVPPEERGKGRCNHLGHQYENESIEDFMARMEDLSFEMEKEKSKLNKKEVDNELIEDYDTVMSNATSITDDDIDHLLESIDMIAGEEMTMDNMHEILAKLDPESLRKLNQIGFDAAAEFSLPITDQDYAEENLNTKIYFANLPDYGIAGKASSITQMFNVIGEVPSSEGTVYIDNNYRNGLTPDEYFDKMFSARAASIAKSVSVAKPGYAIYELQDITIIRK